MDGLERIKNHLKKAHLLDWYKVRMVVVKEDSKVIVRETTNKDNQIILDAIDKVDQEFNIQEQKEIFFKCNPYNYFYRLSDILKENNILNYYDAYKITSNINKMERTKQEWQQGIIKLNQIRVEKMLSSKSKILNNKRFIDWFVNKDTNIDLSEI